MMRDVCVIVEIISVYRFRRILKGLNPTIGTVALHESMRRLEPVII